jgi:hypothetical protein
MSLKTARFASVVAEQQPKFQTLREQMRKQLIERMASEAAH